MGWVTWKDIVIMAAIYVVIGAFLYWKHKTLMLCSAEPEEVERRGLSLKTWDFLFYTAFGMVVTDAVRVAGVLAVFSFLIVPVVCASLLGHKHHRLYWAWGIGIVVSVLGSILSYTKDWPMGATIVCIFGLTVAVISSIVRMKNVED